MPDPALAGVQAHPDLDLARLGPVGGRDGALRGYRCLDRRRWARERGEERIALGLDDGATRALDGAPKQLVVAPDDRRPVRRADGLLEACRALDVREEEGDRWTNRQRHVAVHLGTQGKDGAG